MPKIIDLLPFAPAQGRHMAAPLGIDTPCPFASLTVFALSTRLTITSKKPFLWITMPYEGYLIKYVVTPDLYTCIGWYRREQDFTITISDGTHSCEFLIPGLSNEV